MAVGVPIARGVFDSIENTLLLRVLLTYPVEQIQLVQVARVFTSLKLTMIGIWVALFILGILIKITKKNISRK